MTLSYCVGDGISQEELYFHWKKTFVALNINEKSVKGIPFEKLALQIESDVTLKDVRGCLEVYLKVRRGTRCLGGMENIDHLPRHVPIPKRKRNVNHEAGLGDQRNLCLGEIVLRFALHCQDHSWKHSIEHGAHINIALQCGKSGNAELLEEDLVRVACQLEVSMMHTSKVTPNGDNSDDLTHDKKAIQK